MNDPKFELSETEHEEFCKQAAELESIHQEQADLEIQGKLDSAAKNRLDARMQKISERIEKQVDAELAAALASYVPPRKKSFVLPKRVRTLILYLATFVFIGAALEVSIGKHFVFSYTNDYHSIRQWVLFCYLPMFIIFLYYLEKEILKPPNNNPSFVLKWAFLYPIALVITSGMVVMSPLGWSALLGWATGRHMEYLEGNIVSIGKVYPESYSCKQRGNIEHNGCEVTICLDGFVKNSVLKPGSKVVLAGRQSPLGLYVERIEVK